MRGSVASHAVAIRPGNVTARGNTSVPGSINAPGNTIALGSIRIARARRSAQVSFEVAGCGGDAANSPLESEGLYADKFR